MLKQGANIEEKAANGDRYFSKAIGNALDILSILRRNREPLSLSHITTAAGLSKSSVFRILRTLDQAGYLEQTTGGRYRLSSVMSSLVPDNLPQRLAQVSWPFAQELGREFRETISVAYAFENHIEVVVVLPSPQKIQMGNIVGGIIPPHASSLGKSILAHQPEARKERLLRTYGINRLTDKTITDEVELNRDLDLVRSRGYATDLEESTPEGFCYGAPVRGEDANVIGAISISMPKMRRHSEDKLIPALTTAAQGISKALAR